MSVLQSGITKSLAEAYTIDQSLRFDASGDLARTPSSDGDRVTWTFSTWVKRGNLGSRQIIWAASEVSANKRFFLEFPSTNVMEISEWDGGAASYTFRLVTDAVYRDVGAWYHIVFKYDSTPATPSSSSVSLYVNGDQVTSFSTESYPSQNAETSINCDESHTVGEGGGGSNYDGYLAETYFTDGTAYDADDFGETDSDTNQWKPIDASGLTFGTNGFYQKYAATEANTITDSSEGGFKPSESIDCDILIIGGGGGGGRGNGAYGGGGGGAGGFKYFSGKTLAADTALDVVVGAGAPWDNGEGRSDNSSFGADVALGGGQGRINGETGRGSGGGGTYNYTSGNTGTANQGNTGGNGRADAPPNRSGGGGGGAKNAGSNAGVGTGGNGGDGYEEGTDSVYDWEADDASTVTFDINGTGNSYAGGGGGDGNSGQGSGGAGGGGAAYTGGESNTGGGGGGGSDPGYDGKGGGSGIVIVRYASATAKATGGTITTYTDGVQYQVHTFTASSVNPRHTITANGDVANTRAQKKVGDSSIVFDGTGDYLEIPASSDWEFGTGAYTVEMWFYTAATTQGYFYVCNNLGSISPNWQGLGIEIRTSANSSTVYVNEQVDNTDHYFESTTTGLNDGAWHHMAVSRESAGDAKLFIDGTHEATQDDNYDFDSGGVVNIGRQNWGPGGYFNGYIDEIRVSDTARYTSSFTPQTTEFTADSNTLLLIHSNWDGGFGGDSSGNYNNFTPANLVATDKMVDSPTNNFATLNPLLGALNSATFSEGNLRCKTNTSGGQNVNTTSTISKGSGKWYAEIYIKDGSRTSDYIVGIASDPGNLNRQDYYIGRSATSWGLYVDGDIYNSDSASSYGTTYTTADIIGVALDLDNDKLYFAKNNTWMNSGVPTSGATGTGAISITAGNDYSIGFSCATGGVQWIDNVANFGSDSSFAGNLTAQGNQDSNSIGDFYYEPPTDFLALCTSNLPDPEIALPGENFNSILWTGNGAASHAITGVGFQPDWLWIKARTTTEWNEVYDAVRGSSKIIHSNNDYAESTNTEMLESFDSDGFTVGDRSETNQSGEDYVSWNWLASTVFDPSTAGTIATASGRSNATAGFSIVKYTGTGVATTIGHGLSAAPELVIVKNLDVVNNWGVYSLPLGNTKALYMDTTATADTSINFWNSTTPTASVFSVKQSTITNNSGDEYVGYCFHPVEGYSKIGSYTGNSNADGTFVYTGFRPAYVMIKRTDSTNNWLLRDNKRDPYNVTDHFLAADIGDAETIEVDLDFVSNGMKMREDQATINQGTYIYIAFAESPFKYANAR